MTINLSSDEKYYLSDKLLNDLNKMFKHISSKEGLEDNNVNLRFVSSKEMKELNSHYRGINKDTNVLSFENQDLSKDHTKNIGDIAISYRYVKNEAITQEKNLDDHIMHMFTHGILHILGYDHNNHHQANDMESKEIEFLSKFNIINPYTL